MIGKTLWNEFFNNRDWPLASAVAVDAAARADHSDRPLPTPAANGAGGRVDDGSRFSWFNATSITLGFAFLYIPILLLVIYSFNESKLVTVWGGFSTKWYGSLLAESEA